MSLGHCGLRIADWTSRRIDIAWRGGRRLKSACRYDVVFNGFADTGPALIHTGALRRDPPFPFSPFSGSSPAGGLEGPCAMPAFWQDSLVSIADLRKLPRAEKLKIIETLWSDLTSDDAAFPSPAWHEAELRKTEEEFAAGRIEALDWQEAKKKLRKSFE
jgi:Putative addiction module component